MLYIWFQGYRVYFRSGNLTSVQSVADNRSAVSETLKNLSKWIRLSGLPSNDDTLKTSKNWAVLLNICMYLYSKHHCTVMYSFSKQHCTVMYSHSKQHCTVMYSFSKQHCTVMYSHSKQYCTLNQFQIFFCM